MAAAAVCAGAGFTAWYWERKLEPRRPQALTPQVELNEGGMRVATPGLFLVADLGVFDDELLAYLMTGYLRVIVEREGHLCWLTYARVENGISYVIRLQPDQNLLRAIPYLARLVSARLIPSIDYKWVRQDVTAQYRTQSDTFDMAYGLPVKRRLERLPRAELAAYIRRFIQFKAATDGRVRRGVESLPPPPQGEHAHQMAEDMIAVADFYSLPLDFFLGIGAMENNYLNVMGDLGNTAWKRRAEKGDIILKRGKRGVQVLNESSGVWQVTRETLRYAHRLYRKDKRDYSLLPEHLRPPEELNLDEVTPGVLTTYAGLFFRDLLDRFDGDVATAVAAYNGGPGNPNMKYEEGVRLVAEYARRVMERAAGLQGKPAAGMQFLTAR
jgi:hypothetical protein